VYHAMMRRVMPPWEGGCALESCVDSHAGQLLRRLDGLGIDDNTVAMYSTDNGVETVRWSDGGTTPFHGERGTMH
jgi:arylsulfatase A-like enzyme